ILASTIGFAQYDHNIQLNAGGTIIHSVTEIDSISFNTDGTPVLHLNLASGSTNNYELGLINQVVFSGEPDPYPTGTIHCISGGAEVVDVINPSTGKTWMDRNLGASQIATSSTDEAAYGDLYQWGRSKDGHEKRNSGSTDGFSNSDIPGHSEFLASNFDWRIPQNDNLWQGVNGTNNPCPNGYRLPTGAEWEAERLSWSSNDATGAFTSPLKLSVAGRHHFVNGSINNISNGYYWSSTINDSNSQGLSFSSSNAGIENFFRSFGFSVRCIKD
ncbi:MAG: hypothetical protein ACFCUU_19345, partial [Cyclobacteriaceae bacterium]